MTELYHNFLLINKPAGWTSFDVVGFLRKKYPKKTKVGHAGTLDPFATGLLIVGIGREATKRLDEFKNLPKTYIATIKLGAVSDTFDKTGTIALPLKKGGIRGLLAKIFTNNPPTPFTKGEIENTLKKFIGKQRQLPPMFSAKKINGQRLYELARKGITIKRKKNKIEIFDIKLLEYFPSPIRPELMVKAMRGGTGWGLGNLATLKIEVKCSAGTYIRTLANDLGKKLGCGAYCEELMRTKIGEYKLTDAVDVQNITQLSFLRKQESS